MPKSRLGVNVRQNLLVDAACLAGLIVFILLITSLYITSERNFHWWIDWYERTLTIVTAFAESPAKAFQIIGQSLVSERNRLYALPLLPFFWLFGSSRLVYEIGLALVYLLPFALVMGAIATQLIRVYTRTVFWATALLTLLIPVSWIPTFMGIPDTGGAAFIGLATFIYLQDVRLKRWWRIPVMGLLIGLAILLRRPFVYAGVAFLGGLALQALMFFIAEVQKQPPKSSLTYRFASGSPYLAAIAPFGIFVNANAWRNLLLACVQIGLIGIAAVISLGIVAPQFTQAALTVDYRTLYTAWTLPFSDISTLYASFYGWGTWLLVVLGFSACIVTRTLPFPAVRFIGLSGILSLLIWLVLLRYGNVFYSLQVTPFVILGLVALIWTSWIRLKGNVRTLMLGVVGCYLVGNLMVGLAPIGSISRILHPLFALNMPPLVRTDYDEVVRLVNYLRQVTPKQEPIFVVGYQRLQLTSSMVRGVEQVLYPQKERFLNILPAPEVDSRDYYPLEALLEAQYIVVPSHLPDYSSNPTQQPAVGEWLPNKEYGVVNVVFDAFTQNWEFAQDFQRLPVQFQFEKGVVVNIYQRIRPTALSTTVRTLHTMEQQIGERPGSQGDWIVLSQWFHNTAVKPNQDYTYKLTSFRRDRPSPAFPKVYRFSDSIPLAKELGLHPGEALPNVSLVQERRKLGLGDHNSANRLSTEPNGDRTQQLGTSLLYIGPISDSTTVTGAITYLDPDCTSSSIRVAMLNRAGEIVSSTESVYQHNPKRVTPFELSVQGQNSAYLLFDMLNSNQKDLVQSCILQIQPLSVFSQNE